jgi:hypothetical protein
MIAPTACDYGAYGGGSSAGHDMNDMNMPGMDHSGGAQNPAQQPQVVPVGNTVESTADPAADSDATATTTTARRSDRRFRDREGRYRDRNGRGQSQPTATTVPPPAGAPAEPVGSVTTDPAAPTDPATAAPTDPATAPPVAAAVPPGGADGKNNGLDVLGRDCTQSTLAPHDGFQKSPACVSTQMGEVAAKDKLPSLLIVDAPTSVGKDVPFTLKVSTRNLIRDRFLGAKAGGYYLESSFLDPDSGLQRGHFHTACRILPNTTEAPDSSPDPEFFLATEDKGGSSTPDTVTVQVPGIKNAGRLQCTSWAGDGSHRTPMMTQANETPAIDSVRLTVTNDNAPPTGYAQATGNDPAAAQADAAKQADVKQQEAGAQKPDVEQNGNTDTGNGGGAPAASTKPAPEASASATKPAAAKPVATKPAAADTASASSSSSKEAPAGN